jgi:hypothetical protein
MAAGVSEGYVETLKDPKECHHYGEVQTKEEVGVKKPATSVKAL